MGQDKKSAIIKLSLSMLIFGSIGVFRRYIPLSSAWMACVRGVIGTVFLFCVVAVSKKHVDKKAIKKNLLLLLISGAAIGVNWILLFESYRYTTVAVATLCYYMAPVIVILLAPFLLKEKMTVKKSVCAAVAIIGMLLVSGIFDGGAANIGSGKGILFGLGAAMFYASAVLLNKFIKDISAYDKTIMQLGAAAIVVLPYSLFTSGVQEFTTLTLSQILLLLAVGIVHTGIAYWLYFGSMDKLSGQTVAVYSYIDPAFAVVLSVAVLGENPGVLGIIGAVLILGSTLFSEWTGKKK
ncbi:MAG: EamA family transporter [Lachnospiraceae bacterium]|nr:EamA family transporter [Lachnospiraceae bacterium]MBQ8547715.1 EamA family transporter [Lachnospiraceae bacterium]